MAVRIPMSPDEEGIIRLSCGGQDLEIVVTERPSDPAPNDHTPPPPPPPPSQITSGPAWGRINPVDEAKVMMGLDDFSKVGVKGLIDKVMLAKQQPNESSILFLADKSVNFHQLYKLGESLRESPLGDDFTVAFRSGGLDD